MSQQFTKNQELIQYTYDNLQINVPKGSEEYEKMISGMAYDSMSSELRIARGQTRNLARQYQDIQLQPGQSTDEYDQARLNHLRKVFGKLNGDNICIESPFQVDYGFNIEIGDKFYSNFNLVILDCSIVKIGYGVKFGPNVSLLSATHPLDYNGRVENSIEWAREINIGDYVWLGAGVTVLAGITIGNGTIVGAGSVVNRDLPPNVVAVGSPARVVKHLDQ
ncbi:putative acetyltransferase C18B11.09c [Wickerhamomyces ciferrii]|uniref:Acetyltransferase C18B11.09c n=1 Tax=Wickerhamomyces ciferrii (strain ATCC 14091 / BCRC 22168 / CBS 111 / JCM 3599 / NBRC 0793 / NRRL Y-1031 F-60-10) TaxID=1206466 RepID=K0KJE3_WICCF|nr:putative acetyltransferase C18B11.09c [Wickerhamomyces ciferrii]CCH45360.1 putative acetyltransferase C18B11.09c [Wickerhamomyces ciferrii]